MNMNIQDLTHEAATLVYKLTLKEKAALLSGKDFWTTKAIGGIPSITMTDGPHGVRKAKVGSAIDGEPATCFPTASALASTWNPELLRKVGEAIGIEAQSLDVQVVLGPGVNMKRSPLGGRNFEYFSEDPYLASELAIPYIKGMQSQGVGTSLKHFAANNQEYERMKNSSDLDERTLHEIYLRAFERTVKQAQPWSVMASYNLVNGTHATDSEWLLQDLLRDQWGHTGIVVSDWMAAAIDRPASVKAGTHLEMPGGSNETTTELLEAVKRKELKESVITDRAIQLVANILHVARTKRNDVTYDVDEHHALAREVASEAIVLLKNEKKVLPVEPGKVKSIALIGLFADEPRFQGGGSSQITVTKLDTLREELARTYGESVEITYAQGYRENGDTSYSLVDDAVTAAKQSDVAIVVAGLPAMWEFEGLDRPTLDLPAGINQLIEAVAKANTSTIVTLTNGSAVAMPWLGEVSGVIESWLTGQAGAGALADVISGTVNPSGRLSETFPMRIEDTPAFPDFPNKTGHARYSEGIFIGYRWYETRKIETLFPFGFGLSYTAFAYHGITTSTAKLYDDESLTVKVTVENIGKRAGKEVVQLYISNHDTTEAHPLKELKKFTKVSLEPGEKKSVEFTLTAEDLAFYSDVRHAWTTTPSKYTISVGSSVHDIHASKALELIARQPEQKIITNQSLLKELAAHPRGRKIYALMSVQMGKAFAGPDTKKKTDEALLLTLIGDLPIGRLPAASGGLMSHDFVDAIVTYCTHEGGFHPFESFPYYKEIAKLLARAVTKRKA